MNKKELLENCTMEQLADMVVKYQNASEVKNDEINCLKDQLQRKETAIKQIDDILNELFSVTHDIVNKPDEFKEILKEKIEESKTIADFLPAEPIKVADTINISAETIGKAWGYMNEEIK